MYYHTNHFDGILNDVLSLSLVMAFSAYLNEEGDEKNVHVVVASLLTRIAVRTRRHEELALLQ